MIAIEAPEAGMSDVERLMLAVFIILAVTTMLVVMIMAAKMSDMQTRLDVLEDKATPSFAEEHAEPQVEEVTWETMQAAEDPPAPPSPTSEAEDIEKRGEPIRPRPSPAPRTDTEPKTVAIEQWQVDLDRQYEEAMSAITEPPEEKK